MRYFEDFLAVGLQSTDREFRAGLSVEFLPDAKQNLYERRTEKLRRRHVENQPWWMCGLSDINQLTTDLFQIESKAGVPNATTFCETRKRAV